MKRGNNKMDEQDQNRIVPFNGSKPKKISKIGNVYIEEKRNLDGMQKKVVRDLGNGMKTVQITQVYNKNKGQQSKKN
jgi:hypothetical protein